MISLVRRGRPAASIVIPSTPVPVERHAAEEFQRYIKQMSGAELPVTHSPAEGMPNVLIGSAAPLGGLELPEDALGFDGYVVKTSGEDLILTGVKPYSCLYAVYHLLERHLGCGFFEGGDQVPRLQRVVCQALCRLPSNGRWPICRGCARRSRS